MVIKIFFANSLFVFINSIGIYTTKAIAKIPIYNINPINKGKVGGIKLMFDQGYCLADNQKYNLNVSINQVSN